jgi:hypothetical protein
LGIFLANKGGAAMNEEGQKQDDSTEVSRDNWIDRNVTTKEGKPTLIVEDRAKKSKDKKEFWLGFLFGFLCTLANIAYGLGVLGFIAFLIVYIKKKQDVRLKGLIIGYLSIVAIGLLAFGACIVALLTAKQ